jgi:uncharacterized protein YcnI
MLRRSSLVTALVLGAVLALAGPAFAHVELEPTEATAGATETLTFHVAYEGAATTGLEVELPEGASAVEVPEKAGWTSSVDEATRTVSWSGGNVAQDDTFSVVVKLPTTPGEVLFPAIQKTTEGEVAWISPDEGEAEGTFPAPRLTLTADTSATTSTTTAASTTSTTAELPATTLEVENEEDSDDSAAPWLIGSGIAAIVAIAIGGYLLKRHRDKAEAAGAGSSDAAAPGATDDDGTTP